MCFFHSFLCLLVPQRFLGNFWQHFTTFVGLCSFLLARDFGRPVTDRNIAHLPLKLSQPTSRWSSKELIEYGMSVSFSLSRFDPRMLHLYNHSANKLITDRTNDPPFVSPTPQLCRFYGIMYRSFFRQCSEEEPREIRVEKLEFLKIESRQGTNRTGYSIIIMVSFSPFCI